PGWAIRGAARAAGCLRAEGSGRAARPAFGDARPRRAARWLAGAPPATRIDGKERRARYRPRPARLAGGPCTPLNDLEIARSRALRPLSDIAAQTLGLGPDDLEPYGYTKAKVRLDILHRVPIRPQARYVVVTAITPTPLGEGKTVHTVGISMALNRIGKRAVCTIRQPSMGPVFGIKGGAAGGGYSQVVPPEDFNLHLTGDFHAVTAANNLLAAFLDTSLLLDNPLRIDPATITWRRVFDMNDRALRQIRIGLGGPQNGVPRDTGFDITAASEVMAVLGLSSDLRDLRARLGRIVVAADVDGKPVTAEDLRAAGAMAAILRDAIKPTLMQT